MSERKDLSWEDIFLAMAKSAHWMPDGSSSLDFDKLREELGFEDKVTESRVRPRHRQKTPEEIELTRRRAWGEITS